MIRGPQGSRMPCSSRPNREFAQALTRIFVWRQSFRVGVRADETANSRFEIPQEQSPTKEWDFCMFLAPRGCGLAWRRFGRPRRRCSPCHPGSGAFWAGRLRLRRRHLGPGRVDGLWVLLPPVDSPRSRQCCATPAWHGFLHLSCPKGIRFLNEG